MGQQESKPIDDKEIKEIVERRKKQIEEANISIELAKERRRKREEDTKKLVLEEVKPRRNELEEVKEVREVKEVKLPEKKIKKIRKIELEEVKLPEKKVEKVETVIKVKLPEIKPDIPLFIPKKSENIDISGINICKLYNYVTKVNGFKSNSASPTDTWNVTFENNIISGDKLVPYGFMKIYIDPRSVKSPPVELIALNYELSVYRDIIKPLINYNICHNFVSFISSGEGCNYNDLLNFLKGKLEFNGRTLTDIQCKQNLDRNINIIKNEMSSRPAIQDTKNPYRYTITDSDKENLRFNMILNQNIKNATNLFDWMKIFNSDISRNLTEFWNILFQVCYGCYCMSLSKMVHNDLHAGNVFIEDLIKPVKIMYIINGNTVVVESRYTALIYDFDRGYVERLGRNSMNEGSNCDVASQCNIHIENKDIIKILCYIYDKVPNELKKVLLKLISDKPTMDELINLYNFPRCFLQEIGFRGDAVAKNISFYSKINSTNKILSNIIGQMRSISYDKSKRYPVYSCNSNYFNRDGSLNYRKIKEYQSLIKNSIDDEVKIATERQEQRRLQRELEIQEQLRQEQLRQEQLQRELERLNREQREQQEQELRRQERRIFIENTIRRLSDEYSDNLIMTNYRRNTNSLVYVTTAIPQNILNDGRETTHTIVINIGNHIVNNNQIYLRYFNGEIIEGLTNQNIIDDIANNVNANNNFFLDALRNRLGPFWVPMYASPINIDSSPGGMEIESPRGDLPPTPYEGMQIESPPTNIPEDFYDDL